MGILFAIGALLSWGVGDFLIQRSTRTFGNWVSLFYITAIGTVGFFPFIYKDLAATISHREGITVIAAASIVILLASLLNFEALRVGKISIIEPIFALEVFVTIAFAALGREYLTPLQLFFSAALVCGVFLVSSSSLERFRSIRFEKGVLLAIFGTIAMGTANFLFGLGSRLSSPFLVNWFTSIFLFLVCLAYLASARRLGEVVSGFTRHTPLVLGMGILDNLAWIFFSYSFLFIPIGVATAITESYIALAALLGLIFNREKLKKHQFAGLALAVTGVILLSLVTKN